VTFADEVSIRTQDNETKWVQVHLDRHIHQAQDVEQVLDRHIHLALLVCCRNFDSKAVCVAVLLCALQGFVGFCYVLVGVVLLVFPFGWPCFAHTLGYLFVS